MRLVKLFKGHGTENDFVVLPDLDGRIQLTADLARALCDRHAGVGADGVLRVVRSENEPAAAGMAGDAPFFMDYRNADGSLAEMCGNGVRVFVRYLQHEGLADGAFGVATRGGVRQARVDADGGVTVDMGRPNVLDVRPLVSAGGASAVAGTALELPNPHVVVALPDMASLGALDLTRPPLVEPGLPAGQNVEFVVRRGERHIALRVHERGVGETRSCGTGICAAVVATAGRPDGEPWRVDVPGGTCRVSWQPDGAVLLTGPAVLVAEIEWLGAER